MVVPSCRYIYHIGHNKNQRIKKVGYRYVFAMNKGIESTCAPSLVISVPRLTFSLALKPQTWNITRQQPPFAVFFFPPVNLKIHHMSSQLNVLLPYSKVVHRASFLLI